MENGAEARAERTDPAGAMPNRVLTQDIQRIRTLREDVLLLRFHLARRTDITRMLDATDRLQAESALKSSLAVISAFQSNQALPAAHVSAAASALMHAVDRLVHAARLAEIEDATDEPPPPVTPESLRASLSSNDIARALGGQPEESSRRSIKSEASRFLWKRIWVTLAAFVVALFIQVQINYSPPEAKTQAGADGQTGTQGEVVSAVPIPILTGWIDKPVSKDILIPVSAFFWAITGGLVWILIRFRRFGAAYAFDPAHANVYWARVISGAVTTAILLYFVFGGDEPWADQWMIDLPLWAFVLGYAGRLQVELLRRMVGRIERAMQESRPLGGKKSPKTAGQTPAGSGEQAADEQGPPPLGTLKKPAAAGEKPPKRD